MAVGVKAAVSQGKFLREIRKAGGGGNSIIYTIVIEADAGISNFEYLVATI